LFRGAFLLLGKMERFKTCNAGNRLTAADEMDSRYHCNRLAKSAWTLLREAFLILEIAAAHSEALFHAPERAQDNPPTARLCCSTASRCAGTHPDSVASPGGIDDL
jgi:hypothetical protein